MLEENIIIKLNTRHTALDKIQPDSVIKYTTLDVI